MDEFIPLVNNAPVVKLDDIKPPSEVSNTKKQPTERSAEDKLLLQMKAELADLRNQLKMHKVSVNKQLANKETGSSRQVSSPNDYYEISRIKSYDRIARSRSPPVRRHSPPREFHHNPYDYIPREVVPPIPTLHLPMPSPPAFRYYNDYKGQSMPLPQYNPYEPNTQRYEPTTDRASKIVLGNKHELCIEHNNTDNIKCGYAHMISELQPCQYGSHCNAFDCRAMLHNELDKKRLIEKSAHLIPRLCRYYTRRVSCSYGNQCKYIHWSSKYGIMNSKK